MSKKYYTACITLTPQADRDIKVIFNELNKLGDSAVILNKSYIIRKALQVYARLLRDKISQINIKGECDE